MKRAKKKMNFSQVMRSLHRDLGFLTIGLTIVYALSGIFLIYRNTDFMKVENVEELQLSANIPADGLGQQLRIRNFKLMKEEEGIMYFREGSYNSASGKAVVARKVYPSPLNKLVDLHKVTGNNKMSVVALIYGVILTFFAISALCMYKPKSRKSTRGLVLTAASAIMTLLFVMLV